MTALVWILFPALTMSLGWGLRGYIGGGPLGAMIPGALVAMSLCLLLNRGEEESALIAAFGAVGVGFGGQMTYGQTVGFSVQADTMWWGLLGLGLKGAVWGLLAGVVLGLALEWDRYARRAVMIGLAVMVAGTWIGWKVLNEPKLIYFSNRLDRPRPEIWFGLALGALLLLVWLRRCYPSPHPLRFALWGFAGGGLGFFSGGLVQSLGRQHAPTLTTDYWKLMEFTFGFLFGAAWGWCAWQARERLSGPRKVAPAGSQTPWLVVMLIPIVAALSESLPSRFEYTIAGAGLLAVAFLSDRAAWQIAITMTYCAFSIDFLQSRPSLNQTALWIGVIVTTLAVAWWVDRRPGVRWVFLFLTVAALVDSYCKAFLPPLPRVAPVSVELMFTALALLSLGVWRRLRLQTTLQ